MNKLILLAFLPLSAHALDVTDCQRIAERQSIAPVTVIDGEPIAGYDAIVGRIAGRINGQTETRFYLCTNERIRVGTMAQIAGLVARIEE